MLEATHDRDSFTQLRDSELLVVLVVGEFSCALSVFGSASLVYIILKKREWQKAVFQRIMLGLSLADLVLSGTTMLHPFMLPRSTGLLFAVGNNISCNIAGFITTFGSTSALYSCFLSTYFFLVVRRGLGESLIQNAMEPWIHIASWGLPLILSSLVLVVDKFRPTDILACLASMPDEAEGKDETSQMTIAGIRLVANVTACVPVVIGIVLTWLIFLAVRQQIKRSQEYEFDSSQTQSSNVVEAVGMQAIFYSIAYFNSFFSVVLGIILKVAIDGKDDVRWTSFFSILILYTFFPLQGFFNWLVYVRPKLVVWRRANPEKSWYWAYRQVLSDRPVPTTSVVSSHRRRDTDARTHPTTTLTSTANADQSSSQLK